MSKGVKLINLFPIKTLALASLFGKIMTVDTIKRILSELSRDAALSRHIRPHDLRRTAGYLMQTGGMNIVVIQHQLHHKNVGTTLRNVPPLNDLANIQKHGDNSWFLTVNIGRNSKGKYIRRTKTIKCRTKREAEVGYFASEDDFRSIR